MEIGVRALSTKFLIKTDLKDFPDILLHEFSRTVMHQLTLIVSLLTLLYFLLNNIIQYIRMLHM